VLWERLGKHCAKLCLETEWGITVLRERYLVHCAEREIGEHCAEREYVGTLC